MRHELKAFCCALAGFAFIAWSPAKAADLYKAPPAVAAAYSWSGCYVGANAGFDSGRFGDTVIVPGGTLLIPGIGLIPFLGGSAGVAQSATSAAAGFQGGCRWERADHWILGFEGDFDWTDLHGTAAVYGVDPPFACTTGICDGDTFTDRMHWESSARIVLGHSFGRWLVYGTGGYALTQVTMAANFIPISLPGLPPFSGATAGDTKLVNGGTIGMGTAYAIGRNWEIGAEYRFTFYSEPGAFNLGNAIPVCVQNPFGPGATCANTTATGSKTLETNQIRVKLNYRFD